MDAEIRGVRHAQIPDEQDILLPVKRVGEHDVLPGRRAGAEAVGRNTLVLRIGLPGEDNILRLWEEGEILDSAENREDGVRVRDVLLHDLSGGDGSGARVEIP